MALFLAWTLAYCNKLLTGLPVSTLKTSTTHSLNSSYLKKSQATLLLCWNSSVTPMGGSKSGLTNSPSSSLVTCLYHILSTIACWPSSLVIPLWYASSYQLWDNPPRAAESIGHLQTEGTWFKHCFYVLLYFKQNTFSLWINLLHFESGSKHVPYGVILMIKQNSEYSA
jgi:hypothetical protein